MEKLEIPLQHLSRPWWVVLSDDVNPDSAPRVIASGSRDYCIGFIDGADIGAHAEIVEAAPLIERAKA